MKTNKEITEIVKKHYNFLHRYNDKRKGYRRIKYMRNGFDYGKSAYRRIESSIAAALRKADIDYISCKFELCIGGRGIYEALIIKL
jgi:hypothetical protein